MSRIDDGISFYVLHINRTRVFIIIYSCPNLTFSDNWTILRHHTHRQRQQTNNDKLSHNGFLSDFIG